MNSSVSRKGLIIIFISLSLGFILWGIAFNRGSFPPIEKETLSPYPIRIMGFSNSLYEDNKLVARVEAAEFKINPRKFFAFNIKPLNEATLTDVRLEIHLYKDTSSKVDLLPFGIVESLLVKKGSAGLKGMGKVTRGVIKGLTIEIYKAERLAMIVKAEKAYMNFKNQELKIRNGSIEEVASQKVIKSKLITWDNKTKIFKVPGAYLVETPKGKATGKAIKVDLDFVVSPLAQN